MQGRSFVLHGFNLYFHSYNPNLLNMIYFIHNHNMHVGQMEKNRHLGNSEEKLPVKTTMSVQLLPA